MLAKNAEDLKELILKLKTESEKMRLNVKKTQMMTTAKEEVRIKTDDEEIEVIDSYILGP